MAYAPVHGEERKIYFTTKDTMGTKFGVLITRALRVLCSFVVRSDFLIDAAPGINSVDQTRRHYRNETALT
jgi:hypothetical protein